MLDHWTLLDRIERRHGFAERRSMDPSRATVTPLPRLAELLLTGVDAPVCQAFVEGIERVVVSMESEFPENLFWDLDYLVASLLRDAQEAYPADAGRAAERLSWLVSRVEELQRLFGRHSAIRFRYVHDFLYGFDWSRWVRRDEARRCYLGPFSGEFLQALLLRGQELLELISRDDTKYHRLSDGGARNPFAFSREPEGEIQLHMELARAQLIPVETWRADAVPRYDLAFREVREARARELGLQK